MLTSNEVLGPREREVAGLAGSGLTNVEIARTLGIAEGSVKAHLHKIFAKLGITQRSDLILTNAERRRDQN